MDALFFVGLFAVLVCGACISLAYAHLADAESARTDEPVAPAAKPGFPRRWTASHGLRI